MEEGEDEERERERRERAAKRENESASGASGEDGDPRSHLFFCQKKNTDSKATSALDAHSEDKITQSLAALLHGRTSVVVAHRLQTVKRADAIAVVSRGRVAERGTHGELVAAKGIYAGLVSSSLI